MTPHTAKWRARIDDVSMLSAEAKWGGAIAKFWRKGKKGPVLPSRARHGLLTCPVDPGDSHRRNRNNCLFPRK